MGRPSKGEQSKRERFIRNFFEENPDATVAEANDALKEEWDRGMTPARIQALRYEAHGNVEFPSASSKDEVLLYKQVEEFVKSATSRIRGLHMLKIKVADSGKVSFEYDVNRPVKGKGTLDN